MRSSGRTLGLAMASVAALTLAGLTTVPSEARTIAQGQLGVQLYTAELTGGYTTQFDGQNTSVQLYAGVDDSVPGQNAVRFSYLKGAAQVNIATVPLFQGQATASWVAPSGPEGAAITDLRAQVLDVNGNPVPGAADTNAVAGTPTPNVGFLPVSIAENNRDEVGVSPDGEVVVTGKTREGVFGVGDAFPSTLVLNSGPAAAAPEVFAYSTGDADANDLTPYAALVPVDPANLTADPVDEVVVQTRVFAQGDDTRTFSVYDQRVTTVAQATAPGFPASVAGGPLDEQARWVITVKDQKGKPVSGLDVYESDVTGADLAPGDGMGRLVDNSNVFDSGETDHNGQLTVRLNECNDPGCPAGYGIDGSADQDGFPNVGATYVTVDVDQDGVFDNGLDQILRLSITSVPEDLASIDIHSSLGNVMDADETTTLMFTVKDSLGNPVQNAFLSGTITRDRADNAPADDTLLLPPIPVTDAEGRTQVDLQPGADGEAIDATIDVVSGGTTASLAIETDEALVSWDEYPTTQVLAGTATTEHARVALPSGSALPGRTVGTTLLHPSGGNSVMAPQGEQPAGTITGTPTTASSVTDADGRYAVRVADPALPNGQELDNVLSGSANDLATGFNIEPSDCPPLVPGLPSCLGLDLDWLRTLTPEVLSIHDGVGGTTADGLTPVIGASLAPGAGGLGEVRAFNADGIELDDVQVNLTIDHGTFVDLRVPFENVAVGSPVDFRSAGNSITVDTGSVVVGRGTIIDTRGAFLANIERDEGFDDDGLVDDDIHATVGALSDGHDLTWTTVGTPVNPRAADPLVVALSATQESSVLPRARAGNTAVDAIPGDGSGQVVNYDVRTYDVFGNRTQQVVVEDDDSAVADFVSTGHSDFDLEQPSIRAFASSATDQSINVRLEGSTTWVYADDPLASAFDPADPLAHTVRNPVPLQAGTAQVSWYDVDFDASTYTLGQQGPETVPVGATVTEVVRALDQEGQPLENLKVDFLRAGPSKEDDDTCNETGGLNTCQVTDGNGEAFYDFAGGSQGIAKVAAVLYSDALVRVAVVGPDTVAFVGGDQQRINARLAGRSSGGQDILRVTAPSVAAGATVVLQRKSGSQWVTVGRAKRLDGSGDRQFGVRDRNGDRVTKYRARVASIHGVRGDTTPVRRLR